MTNDLRWITTTTGNYAALAADGGWVYVAGRLDHSWFLESWDANAPRSEPLNSYGFRTRGAAYAEAAEREEVVGLLFGKYGLTYDEAHRLLATARGQALADRPAEYAVKGGRLLVATDDGGYTIDFEETSS